MVCFQELNTINKNAKQYQCLLKTNVTCVFTTNSTKNSILKKLLLVCHVSLTGQFRWYCIAYLNIVCVLLTAEDCQNALCLARPSRTSTEARQCTALGKTIFQPPVESPAKIHSTCSVFRLFSLLYSPTAFSLGN